MLKPPRRQERQGTEDGRASTSGPTVAAEANETNSRFPAPTCFVAVASSRFHLRSVTLTLRKFPVALFTPASNTAFTLTFAPTPADANLDNLAQVAIVQQLSISRKELTAATVAVLFFQKGRIVAEW